MIEIIYKESGEKGEAVVVKPPKNIRQMGIPRGRHKIYVEDYVYTFLHSAVFEGECQKRAAVLLGKSEVSQDIRYTFISGVVSCDDFVFREDEIFFDESCWEYIYKEIKQYFDGQEIVGWFLGLTGFPLELTPMVEAAHRKYFTGRDKVLLLSEPAEQEDVFYAYEQGILQRKEGYYIYYEKNLTMQEYMISSRERAMESRTGAEDPFQLESPERRENERMAERTEEEKPLAAETAESLEPEKRITAEEAIQNYRNMLLERKQEAPSRKMNTFLYIAASAAMVILCVIGITTINNYEKMRQMQDTLAVFANFGKKDEDQKQQEGVVVETVPGQVTPENQQQGNQPEDGQQLEDGQPSSDAQPVSGQPSDPAGAVGQPVGATGISNTYLDQGYYIVEPGDKLELICKKVYQTTAMMDKLCEANQIDDVDKIYAGQKLILP